MPVLLVVDDDPSIRHAFQRAFDEPQYTLLTASKGADAVALVAQRHPDVVILDLTLPDESGLEVFRRIHTIDETLPTIFIDSHGTTENTIEAVKLGAYDYLLKPLELSQLRRVVARAFETRRLVQESTQSNDLLEEQGDLDSIIGRCDAMQEVYKQIGRVAPQDVTVLITGESGTGKELVAQAIWKHSRRSNGPFRALNCAAIPESLLESELFGHEAGAFTGADQRVIGKFEQCNGGTLFLDEIADMTSLSQAKMLRVLQNHQFERIGGCETIQADVRIVAATSRDLMQSVADGGFRKELYFRLSVFSIELPPLRARGDDLMLLAHHFLRRYSLTFGKNVRQIPQETSDLLHRHSWPGNVRELEGVVQQSLLSAVGTTLLPEFLPLQLRRSGLDRLGAAETSRGYVDLDRAVADRMRHGSQNIYAEVLELVERHLVQHVLEITNGNQSQAAKLLGITRKTLRSKIRSLGISLKWLHRDHPDG